MTWARGGLPGTICVCTPTSRGESWTAPALSHGMVFDILGKLSAALALTLMGTDGQGPQEAVLLNDRSFDLTGYKTQAANSSAATPAATAGGSAPKPVKKGVTPLKSAPAATTGGSAAIQVNKDVTQRVAEEKKETDTEKNKKTDTD